ncbi:MAG: aminotransferase class IV [Deltaproteobacteria bacterium]|nr:aminotransferase class IV [Deltaproteobacteria bacterium]
MPKKTEAKIKGLVHLNGKIMPLHKAMIPVMDHGFLYGDSVYDTFRTFSGYPLQLSAHIDRLFHSAKKLQLKSPATKKEIMAQIFRTLSAYWKRFKKEDVYIRVILSRGYGNIGFDLNLCTHPTLIVIIKEIPTFPKKQYEKGISVAIVPTLRNNPKSLDPNIKSGNYLNNLLAYLDAKKQNTQDAVMQNYKGEITEATTSNIFIVKKGTLYTPSLESGLLKGLIRTLLIDIAHKNHLKLIEKKITKQELLHADECFLCGSIKCILPVTSCNHKKIGSGKPGPITQKLMRLFPTAVMECIREEYCLDS